MFNCAQPGVQSLLGASRKGIYRESFRRHDSRRDVVANTSEAGPRGRMKTSLSSRNRPPTSSFAFRPSNDSFIVIDGFTIDAANVAHDAVKITYKDGAAHDIRIKNSEIVNSPGNGISITRNRRLIPSTMSSSTSRFTTTESRTSPIGCTSPAVTIWCAKAASTETPDGASMFTTALYPKLAADNNVIRNNEIFDNGRVGDRGPGIILSSGRNNAAYNNLLWANKGGPSRSTTGPYGPKPPTTPFMPTSTASTLGTKASALRSETMSSSGMMREPSPTRARARCTTHNLTIDPLFVDAAALDSTSYPLARPLTGARRSPGYAGTTKELFAPSAPASKSGR